MSEESSRFPTQRARRVAAVLAIASLGAGAGLIAAGCGSDDNNDDVNKAIDSVQSQASSVQSQISTALTNANEQAQSVQSQAQDQVQSIQGEIDQDQKQDQNGGSDQYGY